MHFDQYVHVHDCICAAVAMMYLAVYNKTSESLSDVKKNTQILSEKLQA